MSASHHGALLPGKGPRDPVRIVLEAGWVPRASQDGVESLTPTDFFFVCVLLFVLRLYLIHPCVFCLCVFTYNTSMFLAGFEPAVPSSDRPQTFALDRLATGICFDPRAVQPVASRYTDWAIPACLFKINIGAILLPFLKVELDFSPQGKNRD